MKIKWMPWDNETDRKMPKGGVPWIDADTVNLLAYLSSVEKFDIPRSTIENALNPVAKWNEVHPLKDYLRNLNWDGESRLESWIVDISGAKDSITTRDISKNCIMQAVARIFQPGAKCDSVLVLEGGQGIRKSTVVKILGGDYYADVFIDPSSKDTVDAIRSKWFVEMSEMAHLRMAETDKIKRFIVCTHDLVRLPYARTTQSYPRQCVFIGTINRDGTGEYLNDTTGNRRYCPVDLGYQKINTDKLIAMRDQLFAEATERVLQGELWYSTDPKVEAAWEMEQKKRQVQDSWFDMVFNFIETNRPYKITSGDVYQGAIQGDMIKFGFVERKRISNILTQMGYSRKTVRKDGKPTMMYVNEKYKVFE